MKDDEAVSLWREYDLAGVVFARDDRQPRCNLTRLNRERPVAAREKWERIKAEQPALAALLRDVAFKATCEVFDAEVLIDE